MPVTQLQKELYTARATSTGGRDGHSKTPDGRLDLKLAKPAEMGGKGDGVNPEQLFAAGYSACFLGALKFVASQDKVQIADTASVSASVTIGTIPQGFGLKVELKVSLPGMDRLEAKKLIAKAHGVCPYSNATRNNIDVNLMLA